MGLRAVLDQAAIAAFDAFDDVPEAATLIVETTVHDPATSTATKVPDPHPIAKAALVRFKVDEVGSPLRGGRSQTEVQASDMKAIFRQGELPAGVVPKHKDRLLADGKDWLIEAVAKDPAEVVWILQLRRR